MSPIYLLFSVYLYCGSWKAKQTCIPHNVWDGIFDGYIIDFDGILRYKPSYDSGLGERHRVPSTSDLLI